MNKQTHLKWKQGQISTNFYFIFNTDLNMKAQTIKLLKDKDLQAHKYLLQIKLNSKQQNKEKYAFYKISNRF